MCQDQKVTLVTLAHLVQKDMMDLKAQKDIQDHQDHQAQKAMKDHRAQKDIQDHLGHPVMSQDHQDHLDHLNHLVILSLTCILVRSTGLMETVLDVIGWKIQTTK